MAQPLALPTFSVGPDDSLATVDAYTQAPPSVANESGQAFPEVEAAQSLLPAPGLASALNSAMAAGQGLASGIASGASSLADSVSSGASAALNGAKDSLSAAKGANLFNTARDTVKLGQALQKGTPVNPFTLLNGVPGLGGAVASMDKGVQKALLAGLSASPQTVTLGAFSSLLPSQYAGMSQSLGGVMNVLAKTPLSAFDNQIAKRRLTENLVQEAAKLGIGGVFEQVMGAGFLNAQDQFKLTRSTLKFLSAKPNLKSLTELANANQGLLGKILVPDHTKDVAKGFGKIQYDPSIFADSPEFTFVGPQPAEQYLDVADAFDKMGGEWKVTSQGQLRALDASMMSEASEDFAGCLRAHAEDQVPTLDLEGIDTTVEEITDPVALEKIFLLDTSDDASDEQYLLAGKVLQVSTEARELTPEEVAELEAEIAADLDFQPVTNAQQEAMRKTLTEAAALKPLPVSDYDQMKAELEAAVKTPVNPNSNVSGAYAGGLGREMTAFFAQQRAARNGLTVEQQAAYDEYRHGPNYRGESEAQWKPLQQQFPYLVPRR